MKDKLYTAALLTLALCGMAARGQDKPKADSQYQILVEKLKSGDRNVNFKELRLAYADSPGGPDTDVQKKAMMVALNARDFAGALKNADVVLAGDYADMDAHFVAYIANRESNAAEQAEFHQFVLKGLLKSITDSGDGKTPQTAFQVIEVHEEYVLLHFMGVGLPESQSLIQRDGHSYDEIKFKEPKSQKDATLYFNVDIPIKHGL